MNAVPHHIAIIMDGNGRWARKQGLPRVEGHKKGAESVQKVVEECVRQGVSYLTLFSFSTENWSRPQDEVTSLMKLLQYYLDSECDKLCSNGIRLRALGNLSRLPNAVRNSLENVITATDQNTKLHVVLALSYGGREEIVFAASKIAEDVRNNVLDSADIDEQTFSSYLWSSGIPDPDLLIRTSGEMRISNFLLWQLAYTEIVVVPEYWPDFDEKCLQRCIAEYHKRERRFGGV